MLLQLRCCSHCGTVQLASRLLAVSWSFKLIFDFGLCTHCEKWAWPVDLHSSSSSPAGMRLHHVNRRGMLTYTSAELRLLSVARYPPQQAVRKRLFTFRLWRPVHRRQLAWKSPQRVIPTSVPITHNRPVWNGLPLQLDSRMFRLNVLEIY